MAYRLLVRNSAGFLAQVNRPRLTPSSRIRNRIHQKIYSICRDISRDRNYRIANTAIVPDTLYCMGCHDTATQN